MASEIRTLLWLQWKLTLTIFRARRADAAARLGRLLLALLMFVTTVPFFAFAAVGLAFVLARISPAAAVELVLIANTAVIFLWLLVPASYNRDLIERLDLARLFPHPVSLPGITAGTALASLFSPMGFAAGLVLAGEVVGLAWHAPLLLPVIAFAALLVLAVMVLTERLIEDLLDLVSGDRRLRGVLMFLMMLPFFILMFGSYGLQILLASEGDHSALWISLFGNVPSVKGLPWDRGFEVLLLYFHPSSVLAWLPTGWGSAAMAWPVAARYLPGLACLLLAVALVAAMGWLHGRVIRRMMQGEALHMSSARVREAGVPGSRLGFALSGPSALWALVAKDWVCLKRSPLTRAVLFASPLLLVIFGFSVWQVTRFLPPSSPVRLGLPFLAGGVLLVAINLAMINFTCNYFGAIDREGFAALLVAPVDARYILVAQGIVTLVFTLAQAAVLLLIVALVFGSWLVVPWGLLVAVVLHVSTLPAYNLVEIVSPYRAQLSVSYQNQGNFWMVLAWMFASVPALACGLAPIFIWPSALFFTLPLAALYAAGLYGLTLRPLSRLFLSRAHRILEVVAQES